MLGALLRLPTHAIVDRVARELGRAGFDDLTAAQFMVFQVLPREGARTTELARRAQMRKQSMSALVRQLIANSYMESVPDPTDRRASIIVRTDRGWEAERVARAAIADLTSEWERALGTERFQAGMEMLEALAELVEFQQEPSDSLLGPDAS